MKRLIVFLLLFCLCFSLFGDEQDAEENKNEEKRNYLGFTPTFIIMGMYGLVYARAVNEHFLFTVVGGYTNFDASPIPFLKNEEFLYQNAYLGLNLTFFPFSNQIFPKGFYFGFDLVPSLGFVKNREIEKKVQENSSQ